MKRQTSAVLQRMILGALLVMAPAIPLQAQPTEVQVQAAAPSQQEGPWMPSGTAEPIPDTEKAAVINGEPYTMRQLKFAYSIRPMPDAFIDADRTLPRLRGEDMEKVLRHVGAIDLLASEAEEKGIKLDETVSEDITAGTERYSSAILYSDVVTSKMKEPTEEEVKAAYEAQREQRYKLPEEMRLRHIWVSTYEPYTVQEGETLESIAEKISGDVKLADKIIVPDTGLPRAEGPGKKDDEAAKEELPPRALMAGEELLVPASEAKAKEAKKKIDEAYQKLKEGEDFQSVAKETSESGTPGTLMAVRPKEGDRPIMPELQEAFMKLEDKGFSEPIRTKHGYQIVYRESYQPEGYNPFEKVRSVVETNLRQERVNKLVSDFFEGLANDSSIVTLNEENIKKETAVLEDVWVVVNGVEMTFQDLKQATRNKVETEEFKGVEGVKKLLPTTGRIQEQLLKAHMAKANYGERPEVKRAQAIIRDTLLGQEHLSQLSEKKAGEVTEADIAQYYGKNKDSFRTPESYALHKIMLPVAEQDGEEGLKRRAGELEKKLASVQSLEEFRQVAQATNPPQDRRVPPDGNIGRRPVHALAQPEVEAIRAVEAPGKTQPIILDNQIVAYWVTEPQKEVVATLEEKSAEILETLHLQKKNEAANEIVEEYAEKAKVEVVYQDK